MKCFILMPLFFIAVHLRAQTPSPSDCAKFHTGTFTTPEDTNLVITRTAKFQYERDKSNKTYVKLRIHWLSDCTYELRFRRTNDAMEKPYLGKTLTVTITSVDGNTFHYSAEFKNAVMKPVKGTMVLTGN